MGEFSNSAREIVTEANKLVVQEFENDQAQILAFKTLATAANDFLVNCRNIDEESDIETLRDQLRQALMARIGNISYGQKSDEYEKILKKSKENLLKIRLKYMYIETFEKALDTYLYGENAKPRKMAMVCSDNDGNVSAYEVDIADIYMHIDSSRKIANSASFFKDKQSIEDMLRSMEQADWVEEHINQAQEAYTGTYRRLERFYQVTSGLRKHFEKSKNGEITGVKDYSQRQGGLLMWKINNNWNIIKVSNYGDIKEGYMHALTMEHKMGCLCGINPESSLWYKSHYLIDAFVRNALVNVTSKAALTEDDVITNFFGGVQFGVKSIGARIAAFGQYVKAAILIGQYKEYPTPKILKDKLESLTPEAERYAERFIVQVADKAVDEVMDEAVQVLKTVESQGKIYSETGFYLDMAMNVKKTVHGGKHDWG